MTAPPSVGSLRRDLAALVLIVLAHCLLFESGLGGSDGWGYFANVESLIEDHDLDLANNLSPLGKGGVTGEVGTADGRLGGIPHPTVPRRVVNSYPLGKALVDAPFYLLGRAAGALAGDRVHFPKMAGTPYEGIPPRRMLCVLALVFGSNLYAAAAVAVAFLALIRLGFPRPVAWAAALLSFFASPMPYYAVNAMSHASATLVSAALLLFWITGPGRPFGLGLLAGLASALRYASAGLAPALGLLLLRRRSPKVLVAFGVGVACLVWIEMTRNWMELGSPLKTLYPPLSESLVFRFTHLPVIDRIPVLNLLLAARHGLLWWSPLVGVSIWGLLSGGGTPARREAVLMAWALFIGQAFLAGVGASYHAGSGFSQRYLCEALPCWALGLALLLERARSGALLVWAVALTSWNYLLFVLTHAKLCRLAAETGTREGWLLSDYLWPLDQGMGLREVLGRVLSATVPGQVAGPMAGGVALVLALLACLGLGIWVRRGWRGIS